MDVYDLRVEWLPDPIGVDEPQPRLSWRLSPSERGRAVLAHRVVVELENAAGTRTVVWDTARVEGAATSTTYAGAPLAPCQRYCWSVTVWSAGSEGASPSSATGCWETGPTLRRDWATTWLAMDRSANRIWAAPSPQDQRTGDTWLLEPTRLFRTEFELPAPAARARLYVTALGLYEARLNGSSVGDRRLAPGFTDYRRRVAYQGYDVTGLVTEGANALGVELADGWYAGFLGYDPKRRGGLFGDTPQFSAVLRVEHPNGLTSVVRTGDGWRYGTGARVYADLLMGESIDARRAVCGWDRPGFDDSAWPHAVRAHPDTEVTPDTGPPIRVMQTLRPVSVTRRGEAFVVDAGENVVGVTRLRVTGPAGSIVRLRHGEVLDPSGDLYVANLRAAAQTDTFVLAGAGEEEFEPRFTFHGFRYVEVTGYPGELTADDIDIRVIHSDSPMTASFECSHELVNSLHRNIVRGQRGNFLSVPTDCPQRDERLGWLADAQVFMRTAMFNMDLASFLTKWLADILDAQAPSGAFPDVAPRIVNERDGAPGWGDAGVILPWEMYRTYGDLRALERAYPAMVAYVDHVLDANPDLVRRNALHMNWGDWLSPGGEYTPTELIGTAYLALDARLCARAARVLGRDADVDRFDALFDKVAAAFVAEFVDDDGRVAGDTQTGYLMALAFGLLPAALRARAVDHLVAALAAHRNHLTTGFLGVSLLCPVLAETGHVDLAYELLLKETFPSWGYCIRRGATTIWERWDGVQEDGELASPMMNSFNHYSLGSVGEFLYGYVAGLRLRSPGPDGSPRLLVAPHVGSDVDWARASYETVAGRATVRWERVGTGLALAVEVPPTGVAEVRIPRALAPDGVVESGRPVEEAGDIRVLNADADWWRFEAGAGLYEFVAR